MSTQIGTGHIFALAGAVLTRIGVSVQPNLKTLRVTHSGTVDKIKNQAGEFSGLIGSGEFLQCEWTYVPEGTTIANSVLSAMLPGLLTGVTISGLPIIASGPFTDALNTNGANTQPWIYEGDGSIQGFDETKWMGNVTLFRYISITSAAAIIV
jgi:hypothetical protein